MRFFTATLTAAALHVGVQIVNAAPYAGLGLGVVARFANPVTVNNIIGAYSRGVDASADDFYAKSPAIDSRVDFAPVPAIQDLSPRQVLNQYPPFPRPPPDCSAVKDTSDTSGTVLYSCKDWSLLVNIMDDILAQRGHGPDEYCKVKYAVDRFHVFDGNGNVNMNVIETMPGLQALLVPYASGTCVPATQSCAAWQEQMMQATQARDANTAFYNANPSTLNLATLDSAKANYQNVVNSRPAGC